MTRIIAPCLFILMLLLSGCAAYKELSPKPPVIPREQGYIELKNDKTNFTLEQGKKYYIQFPRPERDDFYLVLKTNIKPILVSYLANAFDDGALYNARIADTAPTNDSLNVYPVDTKAQTFTWVIDTVRYDAELAMHYRYVPRWRFAFETRFYVLRDLLAGNRIDPTVYNSIGPDYSFKGMEFAKMLSAVELRTRNLTAVKADMEDLGRLFPRDIASTKDTAYENYLLLESDLGTELRRQENYGEVLRILDRDETTRGKPLAFLQSAPLFLGFFEHKDRHRPPVVERIRSVISGRLPEAETYYDGMLRAKADVQEFAPSPSLETLEKLYSGCERQPSPAFRSLLAYVNQFNHESAALLSAQTKLIAMERLTGKDAAWTSDSLYTTLIARATDASASLPESQIERFDAGRGYSCTRLLSTELAKTTAKAIAYQSLYQRALGVVIQIKGDIWPLAESRLRELSHATEYDNVPAALKQREEIANRLDWNLYSRVKTETQQRVDAFIARNATTFDDVASLYRDSAFTPVYRLSFSVGGAGIVSQRRKEIDDYLNMARHLRFAESAVEALYSEFVRNPNDHGIEKARAIAEHGKEYTGNEKQVIGPVQECDPNIPKWITRPKEYRKVYALPVTSAPRGKNEYLVRLRLQIPSEAQFPVFDITVKLPREVAEKAGKEQWFNSLTIDGKPIKNEGRFRITSPTPDNNYESLISPVQMDKEGKNILEIRFEYPGFKVFEVSTMAQVPIIRKN
jgi:hypothetical protein